MNDAEEFIPYLLAYEKIITEPTRSIYGYDGNYFSNLIESFYDEGVFWKKNVFEIPSGKAGKAFIRLQTEWLSKFNTDTNFKRISLKVFMILPIILLQKPSARSKAKDHSEALLRCTDWFQSGDIERLIAEGQEIQRRLKPKKSQQDISKTFSKLMMEGKIDSALRFLSEESQGGIHQLSEKILKDLCQPHPAPTEVQWNSLLFGLICDLRDIRFDIDEQKITEAAQLTKGAAGPSSLDANQFKRILCSKQFNKEGKDLQDQISIFAKNIATKVTDPNCLEAYTANRLIPLDNNPGIRPIGIGEVLRRIVGKAIA